MAWISHSQVSQSTDNFCFENLSFWCVLSTEVMKFSSIEVFAFLSSIGVSSANQTGLYMHKCLMYQKSFYISAHFHVRKQCRSSCIGSCNYKKL
ncbi:hypothetical protein Peur_043845 [Populus x canadensis]